MNNITLISTMHEAFGECNSTALNKILLTIRPDIISEEMPPSYFSKYYLERSESNLEVDAVTMYMKDFKAVNVPVDIEDIPPSDFFKEYQKSNRMYFSISRYKWPKF